MAYRKVGQRSKVAEGLRGVWYEKLCALSFFVPGPSRGRQTLAKFAGSRNMHVQECL